MRYEIQLTGIEKEVAEGLDDYFEKYFANDRDDTSRPAISSSRLYVFEHKSEKGRVNALFALSDNKYSGKISVNINDAVAKEFIAGILKEQPSLEGKIVQVG